MSQLLESIEEQEIRRRRNLQIQIDIFNKRCQRAAEVSKYLQSVYDSGKGSYEQVTTKYAMDVLEDVYECKEVVVPASSIIESDIESDEMDVTTIITSKCAMDIIEDDNVCSDVTIPAASIMNSDVMDDDAVSMIRMDIVNKMKHNSYRACNKLCVAQNLAEIRVGFELSQDAVEEWVLALAAIPSLTDAELRLMTNMIAELLERLIMRGIQLREWLIAKTESGYLTTSWETHNYISNIQMFVGRWVEYLVDIRKDIEDQNKVVVIAVPMQEVVQCQDRKIQEVDIDDETTVESAGEYTDTHSISEYEYGSDTITINSETDGEITDDEGQMENRNTLY
jgi:hypothetical protein